MRVCCLALQACYLLYLASGVRPELPTYYVAAVVEYFPLPEPDSVQKNIKSIETYIETAAKEGAQIVVFPEDGLARRSSRDGLSKQLENIPEKPSLNEKIIPCNNSHYSDRPNFQNLSCYALTHNIAIVVNIGDKQPCSKNTDTDCPSDGFYLYNTNVAFDSDGSYLAKYHKMNLYAAESVTFNTPRVTEVVTFTTSFGVTFGTFTCFDILFKSPAMNLIEQGVKNIIFPTFWGSQFPALVSIAVQQSFSMITSTNFIGANIHCQEELCLLAGLPASGSGIYSNGLALSTYISGEVFSGGQGVVRIAKVPIVHEAEDTCIETCNFVDQDTVQSVQLPTNVLLKPLENATYHPLSDKESSGSLSLSDSGNHLTCHLSYTFNKRVFEEKYALGIYYGPTEYNIGAFCMLVKCSAKGCGEPVQEASSTFKHLRLSGSYPDDVIVFPFMLASELKLLTPKDFTFENNALTLDGLSEPLVAVSLWAHIV